MHRSNSYALWTCCLKQDSCFDYGSRHILGPCLSFASFDLARKRWLWHAGTAVSDPKSQMLQHLMTCGFLPIPSAQVPNSSPGSDDRHEINLYATPLSQRDLIRTILRTEVVDAELALSSAPSRQTPGYSSQMCCQNLQFNQHGQPTRVLGTSTTAKRQSW